MNDDDDDDDDDDDEAKLAHSCHRLTPVSVALNSWEYYCYSSFHG